MDVNSRKTQRVTRTKLRLDNVSRQSFHLAHCMRHRASVRSNLECLIPSRRSPSHPLHCLISSLKFLQPDFELSDDASFPMGSRRMMCSVTRKV